MKTEQFTVEWGDSILVIEADMTPAVARRFVEATRDSLPERVAVVLVRPGAKLSYLDEAALNTLGWYRKPR